MLLLEKKLGNLLFQHLVTLLQYKKFNEFDLDLQMFFSNPNNIIYLAEHNMSFTEDDMFAFKDRSTSIFKRLEFLKLLLFFYIKFNLCLIYI